MKKKIMTCKKMKKLYRKQIKKLMKRKQNIKMTSLKLKIQKQPHLEIYQLLNKDN